MPAPHLVERPVIPDVRSVLEAADLRITTMGRGVDGDRVFFDCAAASAVMPHGGARTGYRGPAMTAFVDDNEDAAPQAPRSPGVVRAIREWVVVLTIALGSAFLIRTFVLAQYYIDGPSMKTTLQPNDRVLVNKLSIGCTT